MINRIFPPCLLATALTLAPDAWPSSRTGDINQPKNALGAESTLGVKANDVPVILEPASMRLLVEVFKRIKDEYINETNNDKLVADCREGIEKLTGPLPASPLKPASTEADGANIESIPRALSNTFAAAHEKSGAGFDGKKVVNACLASMVKGLDPRSEFLDEVRYKALQVGDDNFGSVGLELKSKSGFPMVGETLEGSAGEQAGIKPGDVIVSIDAGSTKDLQLEEVIKRLRGRVGSKVTLSVERKGNTEPLTFSITRRVVQIVSAKVRSIAPGVAYMRVSAFREDTLKLMGKEIERFLSESNGKLNGIVLDLRGNQGGLLFSCVGGAAAFLPQDVLITRTDGRTADSKITLTANRKNYVRGAFTPDPFEKLPPSMKSAPMVVLVNGQTSSGAEIVAAALQDHQRATVVGTRTLGDTTIGTILPLGANTALKLTTAKHFRPSGGTLEQRGVTPDVVLEQDELLPSKFGGEDDKQFARAVLEVGARPQMSRSTIQRSPDCASV